MYSLRSPWIWAIGFGARGRGPLSSSGVLTMRQAVRCKATAASSSSFRPHGTPEALLLLAITSSLRSSCTWALVFAVRGRRPLSPAWGTHSMRRRVRCKATGTSRSTGLAPGLTALQTSCCCSRSCPTSDLRAVDDRGRTGVAAIL